MLLTNHKAPGKWNTKNLCTRKYLLLYTLVFLVAAIGVYYWHLVSESTLIWYKDGFNTHYKSLIYYAQYIRSIIKELIFNHRFVLPEWEFSMGEGMDILQSLHYYVIGDPFTFFAFLVPTRFMWIYYDVMIILRLYCAGLAFSFLCFYTQKNYNMAGVLAGAISYDFCFWAIMLSLRHPYFINPMITFPLLILGIERILAENKHVLFSVTVCISALSNFYFFYMQVLLTVVYAVVRLTAAYHADIREGARKLFKIAVSSVIGVIMSLVIFLPMCITFLNDTRMGGGNAYHLFYPASYYEQLPAAFLSAGYPYYMCMGFSAPALIAVFLLFVRIRKYTFFKVLFLLCGIIILCPFFGQILNGLSYMSNRWCWAFSLLVAYILAMLWDEMMTLSLRDTIMIGVLLALFALLTCSLEYSNTERAHTALWIALAFVVLTCGCFERKSGKWYYAKNVLGLIIVMISVCTVSYYKNAPSQDNYVDQAKKIKRIQKELTRTEARAIKKQAKKDGVTGFFRYSGRNLTRKADLMQRISSTRYSGSISNPHISEFRDLMETMKSKAYTYINYDDRTALTALSSILYYSVPKKDNMPAPYGFEALGETDGYLLYRNQYALPLTYSYDTVMERTDWNDLSAVDRQEAMLESAVVEDYQGRLALEKPAAGAHEIDYEIIDEDNDIVVDDHQFVVTKAGAGVTLSFEGLENSETYLSIQGLDYEGTSLYSLYNGDEKYDPEDRYSKESWETFKDEKKADIEKSDHYYKEKVELHLKATGSLGTVKDMPYYTEDSPLYHGRHDYLINMLYHEEAETSIQITFSDRGIYSFDSLSVVCQPMTGYEQKIEALKSGSLEEMKVDIDTISGKINADQPCILCFSIPYAEGWKAYVDGTETETLNVNIKNIGIELKPGEHEVRMIYHTPFMRTGLVLSVLGIVLLWISVRTGRYGDLKRREK